MPFDAQFLTPRDYLIQKSFILKADAFTGIKVALDSLQTMGGGKREALQGREVDQDNPLLQLLQQLFEQADKLKAAYNETPAICDGILKIAYEAPDDYDEIFDGLNRLYPDEAANSDLRAAVQARINSRLASIRDLSSRQSGAKDGMADAVDQLDLIMMQLDQLPSAGSRSSESHMFRDMCQRGLDGLELSVGAAAAIDMDLEALGDFVANNTDPGPSPVLDIEKGQILSMWEQLANEVEDFKSRFLAA